MEDSRLKFAEDEQPLAGQDPPARRMEAAAPKPGAGRPTKRRRMEIARAARGPPANGETASDFLPAHP